MDSLGFRVAQARALEHCQSEEDLGDTKSIHRMLRVKTCMRQREPEMVWLQRRHCLPVELAFDPPERRVI
jgi:hypothetical protein